MNTGKTPATSSTDRWYDRVESADWKAITAEVDEYGGALLPPLLTPEETVELRSLYEQDGPFRSTVDMARHRFGEGRYRYFDTPYPEPVERLKQALYPRLLPIARDWWTRLGRPAPWPDTLDEWLRMCHDAGQTKPSAILLHYGEKDWNALHRDLYGDLVFPLQVVINLNEPGVDHTGGEFLLLEQRPRAQSRGTATLLPHGHGYLFTTRDRPVRSTRGWSAAPVRHGVSAIRSGVRHTLALVFHDAA
ncbi:2OG-Fe(II) oxygenase [Streptomyces sp. NPDC101237]|uniref:2OG-Fe(II) oxygenase n=1 Tax=Streptomyces sp. NPDC101237 TaxID=3366139 RepID=UPI003801E39F